MGEDADDRLVVASARALANLASARAALEAIEDERADCARAVARGHFSPEEDARLRAWFARYLTVRAALVEIIAELRPHVGEGPTRQARVFLVAYTAAAHLVAMGRFLVTDVAQHKLTQRKLNEAEPRLRIPRKRYTSIYRSLTRPANAWRLTDAIAWADANRAKLDALAGDPDLGRVHATLATVEPALRMRRRSYLMARLRYRWHSWRRRRASAAQRGFYGACEAFGRVIAEMRPPGHIDRATPAIHDAIAALLKPGDVIVTRHDNALSNLFLPGYWPHAALHVGAPDAARGLGVEVDRERAARWAHDLCVLEARKDGVLLRALPDTFAVDAFTIIRPRLKPPDLAAGLSRVLTHEGKEYNFDFDFFTSDRLVCTEVIYRAYEGLGGISFPLMTRSGRPTLSAEDILGLAIRDEGFETVAVYGTPGVGNRLVTGAHAVTALAASLCDVSS